MTIQRSRIALLIDAENLSASYVAEVVAACDQRGKVHYRRAYANWRKASLGNWEAIFRKHAIEAIQQFDFTKGKNAADIALTIDAMDILHDQEVDAFCIASNDGDFTPLVMRLRQSGLEVYGCGTSQVSQAFQEACTQFILLGQAAQNIKNPADSGQKAQKTQLQLVPEPPPQTTIPQQPIPGKQLKQDTILMEILRQVVAKNTNVNGWAEFSVICSSLRQQGHDPKQYGYGKWMTLLKVIDILEIKSVPKSQPLVRIVSKKKTA
jgi:uncharacterized protein (TIGR00288 family)